jgi:hypothetical protein
MTDQGQVWFDYLTTAYVQTGKFEVTETYLPGKHSMPRTAQITPAGTSAATYPETFQREWATFVTGTDTTDKGYDPGAYGIGVQVHERTIVVPQVLPVHLLYYYSVSGTKEERILVQVPSSAVGFSDPGEDLTGIGSQLGLDMLAPDLSRKVRSFSEYVQAFPVKGFNRYGFVLPRGVSRSKVSELHSLSGDWVDVNDAPVVSGVVYFEPMYINNDRPLFDFIYMQSDVTDLDSNVMQIPSRLLRWRGGIPSEAMAPINRSGDALLRDGYFYDTDAGDMAEPQAPTVSIDGVSYTNADAYGTGYKRQ